MFELIPQPLLFSKRRGDKQNSQVITADTPPSFLKERGAGGELGGTVFE